jgi:hypothetical protein
VGNHDVWYTPVGQEERDKQDIARRLAAAAEARKPYDERVAETTRDAAHYLERCIPGLDEYGAKELLVLLKDAIRAEQELQDHIWGAR